MEFRTPDGDEQPEQTDRSSDEPVLDAAPEDVPAQSAEPRGRRYPSTVGGAFYLLILALAGAGLVVVAHGNWRLGVKWVAGSLVFAALVRLVLPADEAGMLAVRRRLVDVVLLAGAGIALFVLSTTIPNQPPL